MRSDGCIHPKEISQLTMMAWSLELFPSGPAELGSAQRSCCRGKWAQSGGESQRNMMLKGQGK